MSIVTFEKPVPRVAEADWYYKVTELKESCDNYRANAFELRHESRKLRNDTDITTYWGTHHTNSKIIDRRTEIMRWKNVIEICYKNIQKEIEDIKNEKEQTEKVLEFLNLNFTITNHCISIRDERGGADLCHDIVSIELKNEHYTLENLKQLLTEICQSAWEQLNKLEELRINIAEDLENKNNTINIDTELWCMTKDSPNISLKPDPLRIPKDTYEKWLQKCNYLKQRVKNELKKSKQLRETMYLPRDKTKNDLRAQNDNVNYGLRKRIYETERIKTELEWQKWNMLNDKDKFLIEIENLENALDRKLNSKKLIETRYEERLYRTGPELCLDETTIGLHEENAQLDNTTRILTEKLNQTKLTYNILTEQVTLIDEELINKIHALGVDQKCLEYRSQLDTIKEESNSK